MAHEKIDEFGLIGRGEREREDIVDLMLRDLSTYSMKVGPYAFPANTMDLIFSLTVFLVAQDDDQSASDIVNNHLRTFFVPAILKRLAEKNPRKEKMIKSKKSHTDLFNAFIHTIFHEDFTKESLEKFYNDITLSFFQACKNRRSPIFFMKLKGGLVTITLEKYLPALVNTERRNKFNTFWAERIVAFSEKESLKTEAHKKQRQLRLQTTIIATILAFLYSSHFYKLSPKSFLETIGFLILGVVTAVLFELANITYSHVIAALWAMSNKEKSLWRFQESRAVPDRPIPNELRTTTTETFLILNSQSQIPVVPLPNVPPKPKDVSPKRPVEKRRRHATKPRKETGKFSTPPISEETGRTDLSAQLGGHVTAIYDPDDLAGSTMFPIRNDRAGNTTRFVLLDPESEHHKSMNHEDWMTCKRTIENVCLEDLEKMQKQVIDLGTAEKTECWEFKIKNRPTRVLGGWAKNIKCGQKQYDVLVLNTPTSKRGKHDRTIVPDQFEKAIYMPPVMSADDASASDQAERKKSGYRPSFAFDATPPSRSCSITF